eukprot:GSMAST32.ASY1.ANO1.2434.1 assembled CDS
MGVLLQQHEDSNDGRNTDGIKRTLSENPPPLKRPRVLEPETTDNVSSYSQTRIDLPLLPDSHVVSATYQANGPIEDKITISSDGASGTSIFAVFDGHGGPLVSTFARNNLAHTENNEISASPVDLKTMEEILRESFLKTEQDYIIHAKEQQLRLRRTRANNAGSCACIIALRGDDLFAMNAGDNIKNIKETKDKKNPRPVQLTTDHNCYNEEEILAVKKRSNDSDAIRPSRQDCTGLLRVGGSLAVTRCLGDLYLKLPDFSRPPFHDHLPYITAEPEINHYQWSAKQFIVVASDGLWDELTNEDVQNLVNDFLRKNDGAPKDCIGVTVADMLILEVLKKVATRHDLTVEQLKRKKQLKQNFLPKKKKKK